MQKLIFATLTFAAVVYSQAGDAEKRQAVLHYELTMEKANELIPAMQEMTKYMLSLPDFAERLRNSKRMTAEEQQAHVEKDGKAMSILKRHGLTARDYVVGVPALRMALMAAQGGGGNSYVIASPANVAFAKAHYAELKPKMDAADGIARPK